MALFIVRNDITRMNTDAIVNSTNCWLEPGGYGADASIHAAAGPELAAALKKIGYCDENKTVITKAYGSIKCRYIIHAASPAYTGDEDDEKMLRECYINCLKTAVEHGCRTIAFPVLSAGAYGYPLREAYFIATTTIRSFLLENDTDMDVYLVLFDRHMLLMGEKLDSSIQRYIDDNYVADKRAKLLRTPATDYITADDELSVHASFAPPLQQQSIRERSEKIRPRRNAERKYSIEQKEAITECNVCLSKEPEEEKTVVKNEDFQSFFSPVSSISYESFKEPEKIGEDDLDKSFSEMLMWWIEKKNLKPAEFYNRANISKATFSSIKKHPERIPVKPTVVACVVGLGLNEEQATDLMLRAGYAFSPANLGDVIVKACIHNGLYDVDRINGLLFDRDCQLLGQRMT